MPDPVNDDFYGDKQFLLARLQQIYEWGKEGLVIKDTTWNAMTQHILRCLGDYHPGKSHQE